MSDVEVRVEGARVWEIWVPGELWTMNLARRSSTHWSVIADATRAIRERAGWAALALDPRPRLEVVRIEAIPHQSNRGRIADVGGHMPVVKAAIDGLVDAGILPDDDPDRVVELLLRRPLRVPVEETGVWLKLRPIV